MIAVGDVAGAGLLAHVPTIMLPYDQRLELNEGKEISLVPGLERLRAEAFEALDYDTVVVLDSHWHTTVEFVVAAQAMRAGLFTSDELPRGMCRIPYDWRGDPELAQAVAGQADRHGTWITAVEDPCLPVHYATVNLWHYLGRGLDKRWVSMSTAQTGDTEDFLRATWPTPLGDGQVKADFKPTTLWKLFKGFEMPRAVVGGARGCGGH